MKKRNGFILTGTVAVIAVLFLFTYGSITGLISSQLSKTSIYYNEDGLPKLEVTTYPDGILEIIYSWDGGRLANITTRIKNSDGSIDTEFVIDRSEKKWASYLNDIEQKARQKQLSKLERTYRKFLITTRLSRL